MCGILGFLGSNDCFEFGIHGLKQLQNRGYDSSGCCCINKSQEKPHFKIKKYASTKIIDAIYKLEKEEQFFNNCKNGIFHTRWATHGAKTDLNAHPHIDYKNKFAIVHNGIIENYHELKKELENQGVTFTSDTDTEVIVNLTSLYYHNNGQKGIKTALMKATSRLQGTWAIVLLCIDKPNNLYCARHGSPLLVGFNETFVMVSSEQAGFSKYVNNYICLNDGDISVIKKLNKQIVFEKIENYVLENITITGNELTPHPYKHWTIKEIYEQYDSSIKATSFGGRLQDGFKVRLGGPLMNKEKLLECEHLLILGCGTSLNAGIHVSYFFKDLCDFNTVQVFDGSEFTLNDIPKFGKSCAVFLSQSGETRDLYKSLELCKSKNLFTIGIINVVDSLIARTVDCGCYLNAGREVGVASTKAFTSQVIVSSMLAILFSQIKGINEMKRTNYIKCLRQLPLDIKKTLDNMQVDEIAKYLSDLQGNNSAFILGQGIMHSVAIEGSLKIKEIGYVHAEGYGGKALRHGPYALIENGTPIILLHPKDENAALMDSTIQEVISRDACVIIITDSQGHKIPNAKFTVLVPENNIYKGILHNIPLQFIAYHIAIIKGHNPDMPRNLSKCVSV